MLFLVSFRLCMENLISYIRWVLWSQVVFDSDYDSIQNNIVTIFNERFFEV